MMAWIKNALIGVAGLVLAVLPAIAQVPGQGLGVPTPALALVVGMPVVGCPPNGVPWNNANALACDDGLQYLGNGGAITLNKKAKWTAPAVGTWQCGDVDGLSPVACTLQAQSVAAGNLNTAGVPLTFNGSRGTGNAACAPIVFNAANAGASGSGQNPLVNVLDYCLTNPGWSVSVPIYLASGATYRIGTANAISLSGSNIVLGNNTQTIVANALYFTTNLDTSLSREGVGVLQEVNGTSPQGLHVYNTSSSANANYERALFDWNTLSNQLSIGTGAAGTGTLRQVVFLGAGWAFGNSNLTTINGEVGLSKIGISGSAPGSTGGKLALICGTTGGTAKLIIYAGTSSTPSAVLDNIGAGVTGC